MADPATPPLREGSTERLVRAGIASPARVAKLVAEMIRVLELDLSGISVLTEAASGPYAVTPVIAQLAGARRVVAIAADSRYASADSVVEQTRALEFLCGVSGTIDIRKGRDLDLFADADLVTNLGFVRPVDAAAVERMRPGAVVTLMCEAWEHREEDVDLGACRRRGVHVVATNEDFPQLDVFNFSGWLAIKLMLDAGIEMYKARVLVIGGDKFAPVIHASLCAAGIAATHMPSIDPSAIGNADVLLVADYTRSGEIIGTGGDIGVSELARIAPGITVVQFAGRVDVAALRAAHITVFPGEPLGARRMARTLAHLGPRPVVELHAAGLKVGAMMLRDELANPTLRSRFAGLAQSISETEQKEA